MRKLISRIIIIIALGALLYSGYNLFTIYMKYHEIEKASEELIEDVVIDKKDKDPTKRKINFKKLLKRNRDVIGWIYVPDTAIDEPILKGETNDSYLHTSIDKQYNFAGQIFIDCDNSSDFMDDNTIIYGHNMLNGSRFAALRKWFNKKGFFKKHRKVYIYLPNGDVNVYKIYACAIINWNNDLYTNTYNDYNEYISSVQSVATIFKEPKSTQNPLIMMSTCVGDGDERYVIFGRLE